MSHLSRVVLGTLFTAALAVTALAAPSITPADAEGASEARRQIASLAKTYNIPREKFVFLGTDGAGITEQAFYAAMAVKEGPGYQVKSGGKGTAKAMQGDKLVARLISKTAMAVGSELPSGKPQCCQADEARKQIKTMAEIMKVAPEKVSYIGVHGKPISEALFYEALATIPALQWTTSANMSYSGETGPNAKEVIGPKEVVARLVQKT